MGDQRWAGVAQRVMALGERAASGAVDSKDPQGPQLAFSPAEWAYFVSYAAEGVSPGDR